jgi:hypothetical protein
MSMGVSAMQDIVSLLMETFVASYVDDELIVEVKSKFDAAFGALRTCWGIVRWPINSKKFATEGTACTSTTFLGVLLDSVRCTASITPKRVASILKLLNSWLAKSIQPSQKAFQSLAGTLNFISEVIPFGRVFAKRFHNPANWNNSISPWLVEDLRWWAAAINKYNGTACFKRIYANLYPHRHVATDAAKFGVGMVDPLALEWASDVWSDEERSSNIAAREFAGILLACALWGPSVAGGFLFVYSDSFASVAVLTNCAAHDVLLTSLLHVAANLQLRFHFRLVVRHIPGVLNGLADQASRSKVQHPVFKRYKQLPIPQPLRSRIGTMLLSGLPLPANLEASSTGQQKELSMSTAGQTATRPQPILHWILWSSLRWDPPNMDVFSILQTGCGTFAS